MDPIVHLARKRVVKACYDLEVQIASVKGGGPCVEIVRRLEDRAAESMAAITMLNIYDPIDQLKYVTLQNEIKRYDEWVCAMRDIIMEGKIYDREFDEQDREEMLDVLLKSPGGHQQAVDMGLVDDVPRDA